MSSQQEIILKNDELILEKSNGVRIIRLNRPKKRNAMTPYMYEMIPEILNTDALDDSVVCTIITGVGDFYTSGNDFKESASLDPETRFEPVRKMVDAYIKYPKLLICVVNGPAIGIGSTAAALCDIIYASDKAYFDTPFIKLGLCCEGTSSYNFTKYLGRSKASEMLLLGERLTVEDAYRLGFISKIIPHSKIESFIDGLRKYGKLPPNSIKTSKSLMTRDYRQILCECNDAEIKELYKCVETEEFNNAMMSFFTKLKL